MSRKFAISIIKVSYTNDKAKRQRYSGCCSGSRLFYVIFREDFLLLNLTVRRGYTKK